jgi:CDP-glycerol glycerophosphotransferase
VLHEDIPVVLTAHHVAEAVDVVGECVYYWRQREGGGAPSITQRRTEVRAVRDRVAAVETVSRFLGAEPGARFARFKRDYDARVLRDDLRLFLGVLPDAGPEYREAFLDAAGRYLAQVGADVVRDLPVDLRVQWLLVRERQMPALLGMLAAHRRRDLPAVSGAVRKYADFEALRAHGVRLPRHALRIDPDLELRAPLGEVTWREDGALVLRGDAWIDRIDLPHRRSSLKAVQLKRHGSRRRLVLPARSVHSPERTADSGQKRHTYDWAGWEVVLDPARLRSGGQWREGVWHVGMRVVASGLMRKRAVQSSGPAAANFPPYRWLDEDHRLLPHNASGALKLRVERVRALVTSRRAAGDDVEIGGRIRVPLADGEDVALHVTNRRSGEVLVHAAELSPAGGGRTAFRVRVPVAELALVTGDGAEARPDRRDWSTELVATTPGGGRRRFSTVVDDGLADLRLPLPAALGDGAGHHELAVLSGHNGYLKFSGRTTRAVLTGAREEEAGLTVTGHTDPRLTGAQLVVTCRDRHDERTVPVRWEADGGFEATFDPATMGDAGGGIPLKAGRWNLVLRHADPRREDTPFVIDRLAAPAFPLRAERGGRRYLLEARWGDFPQLNCRSGLDDFERGPYRQLRLRHEVHAPARALPLRDQVFYLSYNGKQYSDSPRALHEELVRRGSALTHLWAVRDDQVQLPPTARPVRMWSREWFEALATSRWIVTNAHLPEWVERREGQVIVQTWHGTMLKKIGHDIETLHFDREYQNRLALEARNWSLLVSSNRFSTPILRRAFSYDGEILETGYPRNDHLYAPDRAERAEKVRAHLGLPPGKKVVLYAPTWRDDRAHRAGQFAFDLRIDLADARARLGGDHVLLVRRHSNVVDSVPGAGDGFVHDVSEYPDIADLYLVADVLVTDYSSVMFDYAHLKRPMLFFTYDLEHYRDTLRGFYFDFEQDAPGPLVRTSHELVTALRRIEEVREEYAGRYARFHHLFCDLDDGGASARVVDRMLEAAGE